jgi:mono/diheme cytochrome c family protein
MTMLSLRRSPRFSLFACVARSACFIGLALTAGAVFAQEGYSPADIQAGKQLYRVNCTNCHGPNGDQEGWSGKDCLEKHQLA